LQRFELELPMQRSSAVIIAVAVLLGVLVGLGTYTFVYAKGYSYLTNNPAACTKCHVMQAQYEAWLKSSHHSVACGAQKLRRA
jgi:cytochrome c nitrite reductase small subunit